MKYVPFILNLSIRNLSLSVVYYCVDGSLSGFSTLIKLSSLSELLISASLITHVLGSVSNWVFKLLMILGLILPRDYLLIINIRYD